MKYDIILNEQGRGTTQKQIVCQLYVVIMFYLFENYTSVTEGICVDIVGIAQ